ncbi:MAG: hypothetical protein ACLSCV_03935 [Acutalibacteraceae bacterium]
MTTVHRIEKQLIAYTKVRLKCCRYVLILHLRESVR